LAGSYQTKLKILYLLKILNGKSGEDNPLAVNDLISELGKLGISAERKSIYADIKLLEEFGVDVCKARFM
jgi:hypothetical protein